MPLTLTTRVIMAVMVAGLFIDAAGLAALFAPLADAAKLWALYNVLLFSLLTNGLEFAFMLWVPETPVGPAPAPGAAPIVTATRRDIKRGIPATVAALITAALGFSVISGYVTLGAQANGFVIGLAVIASSVLDVIAARETWRR